jgi:hypothetical protein
MLRGNVAHQRALWRRARFSLRDRPAHVLVVDQITPAALHGQ